MLVGIQLNEIQYPRLLTWHIGIKLTDQTTPKTAHDFSYESDAAQLSA